LASAVLDWLALQPFVNSDDEYSGLKDITIKIIRQYGRFLEETALEFYGLPVRGFFEKIGP